jgi:hypothetical protein
MSCASTLARLAAYWLGDLDDAEEQALEEHLWGCDACLAASERTDALVLALRERIPPLLSERAMAVLEARGLRLRRTVVRRGERKVVEFGRDVDLLVHRLQVGDAERVDLEVVDAASGAFLFAIPGMAVDGGELNLVCRRHYAESLPPDASFRLWAGEGDARRLVGEYGVMHVLPYR